MKDREEQLINHYHKALIIKYDNPHIHNKLARIYVKQFKFERASSHYIKSLKLDPNNFKNYWQLKFALLGLTWTNEKIDFDLLEEAIMGSDLKRDKSKSVQSENEVKIKP